MGGWSRFAAFVAFLLFLVFVMIWFANDIAKTQ